MKPRHMILAAGLSIAAWLAFFGDKSSSTDIAQPVARAPSAAAAPPSRVVRAGSPAQPGNATGREPVILALQPRDELIGSTPKDPQDSGLFTNQSWTPPPPPPAKPPPPPPPTAPALPFTYLGKKNEDGVWEVYLARGDHTFIAREQTVIDGIYRVEAIKPPSVSLTYLPLNQMQTLAIGGTD